MASLAADRWAAKTPNHAKKESNEQLIAIIAAIAAIITINAYAERVNVGDYFSLNIPRSWQVKTSGHHVHDEGEYAVYVAHGFRAISVS